MELEFWNLPHLLRLKLCPAGSWEWAVHMGFTLVWGRETRNMGFTQDEQIQWLRHWFLDTSLIPDDDFAAAWTHLELSKRYKWAWGLEFYFKAINGFFCSHFVFVLLLIPPFIFESGDLEGISMKWNQSQQIFPIFDLKNHSGTLWTTAALYVQTNMPCFCHLSFLLFHLNHFFSCNHAPGVRFPNYSSLHIEESEGEKWKEGPSIKPSNSSEK